MNRWEYDIVTVRSHDFREGMERVNKMGINRWELVSVTCDVGNDHRFFFKREYIIQVNSNEVRLDNVNEK